MKYVQDVYLRNPQSIRQTYNTQLIQHIHTLYFS